ncbi:Yip1 domain protein [Roseivivax jejudonensis]|uniref:Yip1 domain protein n=1 Tax=Roseivivax jejudonensis TaxID=1529041 RepID=A0A1X6YS70_9RHOB|nr:YIP1 family protein [Roseivivax jejudonensis]SLN29558.1 Yip1 domain protein [Roseivivax jejudonensis]
MAVTTDIAATYRGPGAVMRRLLAMGQREDRALAMAMGACFLTFLSSLPRLAREAHLTETSLDQMLGGALMGWIFIAPLGLYAIAALSHLVAKAVGGRGDWYGARLALFWSFLASTPLILLNGLVAGLVGPGAGLTLVGVAWCAIFAWFWLRSLKIAEEGA